MTRGVIATSDAVFARLQAEVIRPGLCSHCGSCVGLSSGTLQMEPGARGPLPTPVGASQPDLPPSAFEACPGKGVNYPELCSSVFGAQPANWLLGYWRKVYIGFSANATVRRAGASGGVITQVVLSLLESGKVDGAVLVRQGLPRPWEATPVIATTVAEVMACSQSVYVPVPVNTILAQMEKFEGRLAYVGLPDQVASLRKLQLLGHKGALKVDYVLGPYVGMGMYFGAIESFLRSNGVRTVEEVAELRYREGEWPGYLKIRTHSGRTLRAEKFYYNYLIPFYITRSTLMSVDFTNELADLSVGDAWHPKYEKQGQGFSVVVARSQAGEEILKSAQAQGLLDLQETSIQEALSMHGHMLDFKKRGTFIRMGWRKALGRAIPDYGYRPARLPVRRKLVEVVLVAVFTLCGTPVARKLVEFIPISMLGPIFALARRTWKWASRPTKRAGLYDFRVTTWSNDEASGHAPKPSARFTR